MLVHHAEPTKTACPVYACTRPVEDHSSEDEFGQTWHYDETSGVHWPTGDDDRESVRGELDEEGFPERTSRGSSTGDQA